MVVGHPVVALEGERVGLEEDVFEVADENERGVRVQRRPQLEEVKAKHTRRNPTYIHIILTLTALKSPYLLTYIHTYIHGFM